MSITLSLTGANADVITFGVTPFETDYLIGAEVIGLSVPPVAVRFNEGVGDGGRYVSTRRLFRDIDLPIYIFGTDKLDIETKYRRLIRLLSDREGSLRIKATYDDDTVFYIDGYRNAGGEITYASDTGREYAKITVSLRCPNPYWQNIIPVTANYTTIGAKSITNNGDIPAYPVWTLNGPITNITFTSSNGSWSYDTAILSGDSVIVDSEEKTVISNTGVNKYSGLGLSPNLFALDNGVYTVTISGALTTGTIDLSFKERREVIY
jgi:phage-related protein